MSNEPGKAAIEAAKTISTGLNVRSDYTKSMIATTIQDAIDAEAEPLVAAIKQIEAQTINMTAPIVGPSTLACRLSARASEALAVWRTTHRKKEG